MGWDVWDRRLFGLSHPPFMRLIALLEIKSCFFAMGGWRDEGEMEMWISMTGTYRGIT